MKWTQLAPGSYRSGTYKIDRRRAGGAERYTLHHGENLIRSCITLRAAKLHAEEHRSTLAHIERQTKRGGPFAVLKLSNTPGMHRHLGDVANYQQAVELARANGFDGVVPDYHRDRAGLVYIVGKTDSAGRLLPDTESAL